MPVLVGLVCSVGLSWWTALQAGERQGSLPKLDEVLASPQDLWGDAARSRPNGPDFDFFAALLPPLRYVHAQFRQHPVILATPCGNRKTRVASNGAGIELPAHASMWSDGRVPLAFFVGEPREAFGSDPTRLDEPRWRYGGLPVLENRYRQGEAVVRQTVFASLGPGGEEGPIEVCFELVEGAVAQIEAVLGAELPAESARSLLRFDDRWRRVGEGIVADLSAGESATLAYCFESDGDVEPSRARFARELEHTVSVWSELLRQGMSLVTPEPRVNEAALAQRAGIFLLARGSEMLYSARNGYEQTFEAECGDAALALDLWGLGQDGRFVRALLERPLQRGIENSDRAFQLQLLAESTGITGNRSLVESTRDSWRAAAEGLLDSLDPETGLLPRENYCGDVTRQVHSLNTHANAWRGLRDLGNLLQEFGNAEEAERYARAARELRVVLSRAVDASIRRDVDPPFVPNALFGEEEPHRPLTASYEGSYWNLLAPFTLGSRLFPVGDERSDWIVRTIREQGGLCMGLVRFDQHSGVYANEKAVDDLYTQRYALHCLDRDEPDHVLVSFYGKFAQGMTRGTLVSGEGTGLVPEDSFGRPLYLPPVVSGPALFLQLLRHLLVHERDTDDDGLPDRLDLAMATPRDWLDSAKRFELDHAPSAFGELALSFESRLDEGEVIARVRPPSRAPRTTRLHVRLPAGWVLGDGAVDGEPVEAVGVEAFDVTGQRQSFEIRWRVRRVGDEGR